MRTEMTAEEERAYREYRRLLQVDTLAWSEERRDQWGRQVSAAWTAMGPVAQRLEEAR